MKTVITSTGDSLDADFDLRFGRAGWFCLFDEETGAIDFEENEFKDVNGGAGTRAAEKMVEMGVKKVISGDFGPKAKDLLDKFGIQMVVLQADDQTIADIVNRMRA